MSRVLLVVPPFYQVFTPALGVSLLKATLAHTGVPCDVLYFNIPYAERIGLELYTRIAGEGRFDALAAEWIFAGDLFGDRAPDPQRYVDDVILGRFADFYDRAFADRLMEARAGAPAFLDEVIDHVAWDRYVLVGVSSTHLQTCAGLALLRRLKIRHPGICTVMGGANCEGEMGASIHALFPFVDYVCSGEADHVFPELVRRLLVGESMRGLQGIFTRGSWNLMNGTTHTPMVLDLDNLPYPDYDDYFDQFSASRLASVETPTMALETSRGCWWGQKHHCTFCGLNGEGMQYRRKAPARALSEIDFLVARYPSRTFYATDNILDLEYFDTVLQELAERSRPPRLYYMMKANLTKAQLRLLARAGFWGIYAGIESLSTPILRLMKKGVSGLQNVRLLKWSAEIGLPVDWALLVGFPGEDPAEYHQLSELIPSLTHLRPPAGPYPIRVDRFSPYFTAPQASGITNVRAGIAYQHVYPFPPADLNRLAYYFDYEHADGRDPATYTRSLQATLEEWRQHCGTARLELRVGKERLEIDDTRPASPGSTTVLRGAARLAYLALDAGTTIETVDAELREALGGDAPSVREIEQWLSQWLDARLVMREGSRYMSLATNLAERVQLPVDRFFAQLSGRAS